MKGTLLVINVDKVAPGTFEHLNSLGIDYIITEADEAPSVQIVPSKPDRRFEAARSAMQGLLACGAVGQGEIADRAIEYGDALLAKLDKPT